VKNMSFIVITYDPSFNAFLMLTIDRFLNDCSPPLRFMVMSRRSQQSLTILPLVARRLFRLANSPKAGAIVAAVTGNVHTPTMTLKNAALLALIGTALMTALLVWNFVFNLLNLLRGLIPAVTLFSSFIYAFGCFSVMVFFYVFHRAQ
jgi:hypothetical protein